MSFIARNDSISPEMSVVFVSRPVIFLYFSNCLTVRLSPSYPIDLILSDLIVFCQLSLSAVGLRQTFVMFWTSIHFGTMYFARSM